VEKKDGDVAAIHGEALLVHGGVFRYVGDSLPLSRQRSLCCQISKGPIELDRRASGFTNEVVCRII